MIDKSFIDIDDDRINIKTKFILKLLNAEAFDLLDNYIEANNIKLNKIDLVYRDYQPDAIYSLYTIVDNPKSIEYLLNKKVPVNELNGTLLKYPEVFDALFNSPLCDKQQKSNLVANINRYNGDLIGDYVYSKNYNKEGLKQLVDLGVFLDVDATEFDGHILGPAIRKINHLEIEAKKNNGLTIEQQAQLNKSNQLVKDICEFKIDKNFSRIKELVKYNDYELFNNKPTVINSILKNIKDIEPIYNNFSLHHLQSSIRANDIDGIKTNLEQFNQLNLNFNQLALRKDLLIGVENAKTINFLVENANLNFNNIPENSNDSIKEYFVSFSDNINKGRNKSETIEGLNKLIDDLGSKNLLINSGAIKNQIKMETTRLLLSVHKDVVKTIKDVNLENIYEKVDKKYIAQEKNKPIELENRLNEIVKKSLNIDLNSEKDPLVISTCNELKNQYRANEEAKIYLKLNLLKNQDINIILESELNQNKLSKEIDKISSYSIPELLKYREVLSETKTFSSDIKKEKTNSDLEI